MMCSKVIYTGLIKNEIGNWNSEGYFHELVQYAKNLGGKKNLVEQQIIKMIRKISKHHLSFFSHLIVKITQSVCYIGPYRKNLLNKQKIFRN